MLVALSAPAIALTLGWHWALVFTAALIVVLLALVQPVRETWDADREPGADSRPQRFGGVPLVMREPALSWVSLAGLLFAAMQRCLITFTVIYLVVEKDYSLIDAGVMLSMLHVGGIAGPAPPCSNA